jgi:hypothetical protein
VEVEPHDFYESALLDRQWEAFAVVFAIGWERPLRRFGGFSVAGVELASEPAHLDSWPPPGTGGLS